MVTTQLTSPAKINLMLRVLGQRTDGYHVLQTCFQLVDWGDEISFKPTQESGSNDIEITGVEGVTNEENLMYQAAQMLKPWAQKHSDWKIDVKKRIPMGAGLGGGSSNAAAVLKFFNQTWQCDLSLFDLLAMGAKLGADVPVFLYGKSALARGIGDEITPKQFATPYILLVFPDCHINTAELFKAPELVRDQVPLADEKLHQTAFWINDFMPVVLQKFPQVMRVYQQLKPIMNLRLSGSGSTMFALFNNQQSAQQAYHSASSVCRAQLAHPL